LLSPPKAAIFTAGRCVRAGARKPDGLRCGKSTGTERERRDDHRGGSETAKGGVWLATSDDLPGLIVETGTREEAIDLSPELALELLREIGKPSNKPHRKFVFIFP